MQLKLYALRKANKLSQKDMANYLGISENGYRNKELGHTYFNSKEMFEIGNLFNKTIDDIFLPSNVPNGDIKRKG